MYSEMYSDDHQPPQYAPFAQTPPATHEGYAAYAAIPPATSPGVQSLLSLQCSSTSSPASPLSLPATLSTSPASTLHLSYFSTLSPLSPLAKSQEFALDAYPAGSWGAHTLEHSAALAAAPGAHRTLSRVLRDVAVRESDAYHLAYGLASLMNRWNDGEFELDDASPRAELLSIDLPAITPHGMYPMSPFQEAYTALVNDGRPGNTSRLSPVLEAKSDTAQTPAHSRGGPARLDMVHPDRTLVARCACGVHSAPLATLSVAALPDRRLTRQALGRWASAVQWRNFVAALETVPAPAKHDPQVPNGAVIDSHVVSTGMWGGERTLRPVLRGSEIAVVRGRLGLRLMAEVDGHVA